MLTFSLIKATASIPNLWTSQTHRSYRMLGPGMSRVEVTVRNGHGMPGSAPLGADAISLLLHYHCRDCGDFPRLTRIKRLGCRRGCGLWTVGSVTQEASSTSRCGATSIAHQTRGLERSKTLATVTIRCNVPARYGRHRASSCAHPLSSVHVLKGLRQGQGSL